MQCVLSGDSCINRFGGHLHNISPNMFNISYNILHYSKNTAWRESVYFEPFTLLPYILTKDTNNTNYHSTHMLTPAITSSTTPSIPTPTTLPSSHSSSSFHSFPPSSSFLSRHPSTHTSFTHTPSPTLLYMPPLPTHTYPYNHTFRPHPLNKSFSTHNPPSTTKPLPTRPRHSKQVTV